MQNLIFQIWRENRKPFDFCGLSISFEQVFIQNLIFEWKMINRMIFLIYHSVFWFIIWFFFVFDFSKNSNQTDRFLVKIGFVGFCENWEIFIDIEMHCCGGSQAGTDEGAFDQVIIVAGLISGGKALALVTPWCNH
jgi:hypothetical protein